MRQEKNTYCLCAVIQEIFLKNNIKLSQKEIADNLTPAEKGFRIDDKKIKDFMNNQGFFYEFYWHNETPFNEPETLLEDIAKNFGFIGINYHVYRVIDFKEPQIILCNPFDESIEKRNYYTLLKELKEKDGGFGLIKKLN